MYDELVALLRKKYDKAPMVMEAADAIEELSRAVSVWAKRAMAWAEKAEEAHRWIPVTERLPDEKRASYLCLTDCGYCHEVRWTNSIYGLVESDNWGWSIFDIPQFSRITHWMPLPEPPKEEA